MILSSILFAFLSLAAVAYGYPIYNSPIISQAQLEELFRDGVESFANTHQSEIQELSRTTANTSSTQACEDIYLIFARGTFEPASTNNLGIMVGPQFSQALSTALGSKFGAAGVDYNNSVMGYLSGGDTAGGVTMAGMISSKALQCPRTKIIASGYSQGAQVTHNALGLVSFAAKRNIAAVVVFGDPNKGKRILGVGNDKIYTDCAASDPICMGIPLPLGSHLTYGTDTSEIGKIVQFVQAHV